MRVFALSDIHVDYAANMHWLVNLSGYDYTQDVLLLAGDISDLPEHLEKVFMSLERKFKHVFFVPGNHDLWVRRCGSGSSFDKFDLVMRMARNCGVRTSTWHGDAFSVVPLLSWYDYSFGEPDDRLKEGWADFFACSWPVAYDDAQITKYFLGKNSDTPSLRSETVISFSHFLPRIDVMPAFIPQSQRYLYPVLGSSALGEQVAKLNPKTHVYGHSHVNQRVVLDGVEYVNNAFGYPSETGIARKRLTCVYDSAIADVAGV